ncbi:MAG TPA: GGDEF domain-containing protein [Candidatus Cloacimonadota bacterium]|nr:GGDEF domain-containing protein [Candidatus Cloacimonadota bacterium]
MAKQHELVSLESILPEYRKRVQGLIPALIDAVDAEREALIDQILALEETELLCSSAVMIDEFISYLSDLRCSHDSNLTDYLSLLNHIPVREHSSWYNSLKAQLQKEYPDPAPALARFDLLQLLLLLSQIGDSINSKALANKLESSVKPGELRLSIIYGLAYSNILLQEGRVPELKRLWLSLVLHCFYHDGAECAIFILIRWVCGLNWDDRTDLKKELLLKLDAMLKERKGQNSALVLYELFDLPGKQITHARKYEYFKRLAKLQPTLLSVYQLQILYFFAGNYSSGIESRFRESILYYQYSNYFLYKCWDQMLNTGEYLRKFMTPEQYFVVVPILEQRVHALGNQISLQNNAYVETLQADYNKIEKLYEQVGELSLTDALTGLRNRRYLQNNIYHMIHLASRHQVPISFAMIDIDHFKEVNDTHGHAAGDYVLKELSQIITKGFRKSDIIIRWGGEEFLMLLFDTLIVPAMAIMEEVRAAVEEHDFIFQGQAIPITISIGLSRNNTFDKKELDIAAKIEEADKAMYQAKNTGRNRVCAFDEINPPLTVLTD